MSNNLNNLTPGLFSGAARGLVLLLVLGALTAISSGEAKAAVWYVNDTSMVADSFTTQVGADTQDGMTPSTPLRSIDSAVALMAAGDTIYVDAGTFLQSDTLIIDTNTIWLIGVDSALTIIDFVDSSALNARAIFSQNVFGLTIRDLWVRNAYVGVWWENVDTSVVENVRASFSAEGFDVTLGSSGNRFTSLWIENTSDVGFYLDGSSGNTIETSLIDGGGNNGLWLVSANNSSVIGNTISNATTDGLVLNGVSSSTVSGNTITNPTSSGIYVVNGAGVVNNNTIINNLISGPAAEGILLDGAITGNALLSNTIRNAGAEGIRLGVDGLAANALSDTVAFNLIENATLDGIRFSDNADLNRVFANEIRNSGGAGINVPARTFGGPANAAGAGGANVIEYNNSINNAVAMANATPADNLMAQNLDYVAGVPNFTFGDRSLSNETATVIADIDLDGDAANDNGATAYFIGPYGNADPLVARANNPMTATSIRVDGIPTTGVTIGNLTPEISWTVADADGNSQTDRWIQIATDAAFTALVVDSAVYDTRPNVPAGTLSFNTLYYVRIALNDGVGDSADVYWSAGFSATGDSFTIIDTTLANVWYVNDTSTTGDSFTTAIGYDTNPGLDARHPKRTIGFIDQSLTAGDTVYIDAGTFLEPDTITIPASSVALIGVDSSVTVIDFNNITSAGARAIYAVGRQSIVLRDFWVTRGLNGIWFDNVDSSIIERVRADGHGEDGIWLNAGSSNDTIQNILASGNTLHGINLLGSSGNWVMNSTFSGNLNDGIFLSTGADTNRITGNTSSSNTNNGTYMNASIGNIFSGNIHDGNGTGFYVDAGSNGNTFASNTASGNSNDGIFLNSASNNTLTSNTSSGNTSAGIRLFNSSNNTLIQNTADSNASWGFYVSGTSTADTFHKNVYIGSPTRPDSGVFNAATSGFQFDFTRNWFGTTDSAAIRAKIGGTTEAHRDSITYTPFRLGIVDTAVGADTIAPAAPTGIAADTGIPGRVQLTWTDPAADEEGGGLSGFAAVRIYRDTDPNQANWKANSFLASVAPAAQAYEDAAVTFGETYYYRLTAVDAADSENEAFFTNGLQAAVVTPGVWYVNDTSQVGDSFTSSIGYDTNPGTADSPFLTIAKALSVSETGAVIYIDAGNYVPADTITIDTNYVTLQGVDSALTVIDFNDMTAANARAIYASGRQSLTIRDLAVTRGRYGVWFNNVDLSTIERVSTDTNGPSGIFLEVGSDTNTLTNNSSSNNSWMGFELSSSSNNTLTNNSSLNNSSHGFMLTSSSNNTLTNNSSSNNSLYGFYLFTALNNTLMNNSSSNNSSHGFWLESSSNNTLTNNSSSNNLSHGFRLNSSSNTNTLTSNTSFGNTIYGISLSSASNNTLTQNTVDSNASWGFYVDGTSSADTFHKNVYIGGVANPDSGVFNAATSGFLFDFTRNWFGTTDSAAIRAKIGGTTEAHRDSITFTPYRLGIVDTAPNADTVAPNAPDTVAAVAIDDTTILVSWQASSGSEEAEAAAGLAGYRVYRSPTADTSLWVQVADLGAAAISYNDTGLVAGDAYFYRVTAYDAASPYENESFFSDSIPGATPPEWVNVAEPMGVNTGLENTSVGWGDYDNDGDLDLLVAGMDNAGNRRLIVFRNDGGDAFTNVAEPMGANLGLSDAEVTWGDYNNDGLLDFAAAGADGANQRFIIFRNDGGDVFTNVAEPMGVNVGVSFPGLDWGDFDNDGDLDILAAGGDGANNRLIVFRNDGADVFTQHSEPMGANIGLSSGSIQWGDFDGDGDLDILATGGDGTNNRLIVFRNDEGTFVNAAEPMGANVGVTNGFARWGDQNNDGDLDFIVSGFDGTNRRLIVFDNDGAGGFTNIAEPMGANLGVSGSSVEWADFNNDGLLDFVVTGADATNRHFIIFRNAGGGSFVNSSEPMGPAEGFANSDVKFGDYNGDGLVDIAVAGTDGANRRVIIYRNATGSPTNERPAAPTLVSPVNGANFTVGNTVNFEWTAVSTDTTPSASITYNVYIGTGPARVEIMSADTDPTHASHHVLLGNVQNGETFYIQSDTRLPAGTYYWSVQAVDGGQMRSIWATEDSFTVIPPYAGPIWYVNDTDVTGDVFTSAIGADTGDGSETAPFLRIDSAVAMASAGETVQLDAGTYWPSDTITIDTNGLFLLGVDSTLTVIDFQDSTAAGARAIYATNVTNLTVRDLNVTNGRYGIWWKNVDLSTIQEVTADYSGFGFYLESNSDTNTLSSNTASNISIDAFRLWVSNQNNTLSQNAASDNGRFGFYLNSSENNTLTLNTASNNTDNGFYLESTSNNNTLTENTSENNATHGFMLWNSHGNTLSSNVSANNTQSGFNIDASGNNLFTQNTIDSNASWGINITDPTAVADTFAKNNYTGTPTNPDSGVRNTTANVFDFTRNWWGTTDSAAIQAKISGAGADSITFSPYRLGIVDTAPGADTVAPNAPDSVAAVALDDTSIRVSWKASSGSEESEAAAGLSGYRVYRSLTADTSLWVQIADLGAAAVTHDDTGLVAGDEYFYRVTAYDAASPYENESFFSDSSPGATPPYTGPIWYVNDTDVTGDVFTTAIGADTGIGSPSRPFLRIDSALVKAGIGETVQLDAGTYVPSDTITIDTNGLFLLGVDSALTVIDFNNTTTTGNRSIYASNLTNLTIRGIKVMRGWTGIFWTNVDLSTILDVRSDSHGLNGITLQTGSDTNTLTGNEVSLNASHGIRLSSSSNNTLTSNFVTNHGTNGFYLFTSPRNTLANNVSRSNQHGYNLESASDNILNGNTASGNAVQGFLVQSSSHRNRFTSNRSTANNASGFALSSSNEGVFLSNTADNNLSFGFSVVSSANNRFDQNTTDSNASWGITIQNSTSVTDTFTKHVFLSSPYVPDSAVSNATGNIFRFTRNWWGTTDSVAIRAKISGTGADSITYLPFRLGIVDTAAGADTVAPNAPDTVAAEALSSSEIRVTWQASTGSEEAEAAANLTGYRIYRSATADTSFWVQVGQVGTTDGDSFTNTGLAAGETWYYRVTAFDNHATENQSFFSDSIVGAQTMSIWSGPIWYVNDTATANDSFTTQIGSDTGDGSASAPFLRIDSALVKAGVGETVQLDAGTYWPSDTIIIDTNGLFFLGVDSALTVIDFQDSSSGGQLSVYAANVADLTLRDFHVTNARSGINWDNVDLSLITGVRITHSGASGIELNAGSDTNTISSSISSLNGGMGIRLDASFNNSILSNQLTSNLGWGVFIRSGSDGNKIHDNLSENPGQNTTNGGFGLDSSDNNVFLRNIARNNRGSGFAVEFNSDLNLFEQNTIDSNQQWAILIKDAGTEADSFRKNIIITPPTRPDSGVFSGVSAVTFDLTRNFWMRGGSGTTDSSVIRGMITGTGADSIIFVPYRLGIVDTAPGADTVAPNAPDTVAAVALDDTSILVSWAPSAGSEEPEPAPGQATYYVYRSPVADTSLWIRVGAAAFGPGDTFVDTGLTPATTYYYRVTVADAWTPENESFFSDSEAFATTAAPPLYTGPIWYVNDTATANDSFTTQIGADTGDGSASAPFLRIDSALAKASAGETVVLDAGTYWSSDSIVIDTNGLFFLGVDSALTVIQFDTRSAVGGRAVFASGQTGLTLRDFRVTAGYRGIWWENVDNSLIERVRADTNGAEGFYLGTGPNGDTLFFVWARENGTEGIELTGGGGANLVRNATIETNAGTGIVILSGSSRVETSVVRSNGTLTSHEGISVAASNVTLFGNRVEATIGIEISLTSVANGAVIDSNVVIGMGTQIGINVSGADNVVIRANDISNNTFGVILTTNAFTGTITSNRIHNNSRGLQLDNTAAAGHVVRDNEFLNNSFRGILLTSTSGNLIERNLIRGTGNNAIEFSVASSQVLTANEIDSNSGYAVIISGASSGNTLDRNNITRNDTDGIRNDATGETVTALRNWWGVTNEDTILARQAGTAANLVLFLPYRLGQVDTFAGTDTVAPEAPAIVSADTSTAGQITVVWTAPIVDENGAALSGLAAYRLYRSTDSGAADWAAGLVGQSTAPDTDFVDTGVTAGLTYFYRVTAVDSETIENESFFSDTFAATATAEYTGPIWYVNDTSMANDSFTSAIGADTGDGSPGSPFLRIDSALVKAGVGETVQLDAGTYWPSDTIVIDTNGLFFQGVDSALTLINFNNTSSDSARAIFGLNAVGLRIRDLRVESGRHGIWLRNVDSGTVERVRTENNGFWGFNVEGTSVGSVIRNSSARDNSGSGFRIDGNEATLESNLASGHPFFGFDLGGDSITLIENVAEANGNGGFVAGAPAEFLVYRRNISRQNGKDGFKLGRSAAAFEQNVSDSNTDWAFHYTGNTGFSAAKNILLPSPSRPDSGMLNTGAGLIDMSRNWWGTKDSSAIGNMVYNTGGGTVVYIPFRLGIVDTAPGADTVAPNAPDTVAVETISETIVRISWAAVTTNEEASPFAANVAGYRVYGADTPDSNSWDLIADVPVSVLEFDDTDLIPGASFYVRATAYDNQANAVYENESFFSDSVANAVTAPGYQGPIWYVNDGDTTGDVFTLAIGSDTSGDGSETFPFRTMFKAMSVISSGETILIDAGTYSESWTVDTDAITITGADSTATTFDAGDSSANTIRGIFAGSRREITITDLGVRNAGRGIEFSSTTFSELRRIRVEYSGFQGIFVTSNSDSVHIEDVFSANNSGAGIMAQNSDSVVLLNSRSELSGGNGIYFNAVSWGRIFGSTSANNTSDGIDIQGGSNNTIESNVSQGNAMGIRLRASTTGNLVTGNTSEANSNAGFHFLNATDNSLSNNISRNNSADGLFFSLSSDRNIAENNSITGNAARGISFSSADSNIIRNNLIFNNGGEGVYILDGVQNQFTQNDIDSSGGEAVYLDGNAANDLRKNNLFGAPGRPDSVVFNNTGNFSNFQRNWWGTKDSGIIRSRINGPGDTLISYIPFRLTSIDTTPGADTVAPNAPDSVVAVALSDTAIQVTWGASSGSEEAEAIANPTFYLIYRSSTPDTTFWQEVGEAAFGTQIFDDSGLSSGSTWYYRITTEDSKVPEGNESYFSDSIAAATTLSYDGPIWYVNDTSTANDSFTSAIGADTGDGSPGSPFLRIDSALVKAGVGETVQLDAGTYWPSDTIVIDTGGIFFMGVDSALTVIDFNNTTADSSRAIYATIKTNLTFRDFHVTRGFHGIFFNNVDFSTVENVRSDLHGSRGFYLIAGSGTNTLRNNTAETNILGGFWLDASNNNTLIMNLSRSNSQHGFTLFNSSSGNVIEQNEARGNSFQGIFLGNSSGNLVFNNGSFNNFNGFLLQGSSNNSFIQNQSEGNSSYQFRVENSSNNDTFAKNNIFPPAGNPDSGVFNSSGNIHNFMRNWWGTPDSTAIRAKISGADADSINFAPYRLEIVDTAPNADTIAPRAPDSVTVSILSDTALQITWSATSINEEDGTAVADLAGYRIWRDTSSANALNGVLTAVASVGAGTTLYVDSGLTPGQQYFYRVTAFDNHTTENQSFFSDTIATDTTASIDTSGPNAWYVNDTSTAGDSFTTAIGSDGNDGLTPGTPKRTISTVIPLLTAGDTLYIDAGTYLSDTINVTTSGIWIIGVDSAATILDGNDTTVANVAAIVISGDSSVVIRNIGLIRHYRGIVNTNGDSLTIENVNVSLTGLAGIRIDGGTGSRISLSRIEQTGGNSIELANAVSEIVIETNVLYRPGGSSSGLHIPAGPTNGRIYHNTVDVERTDAWFAIWLTGGDSFVVSDNRVLNVHGNDAISVDNGGSWNILEHNLIRNVTGANSVINIVHAATVGNVLRMNHADSIATSKAIWRVNISDSTNLWIKNTASNIEASTVWAEVLGTSDSPTMARFYWGTTDSSLIASRITGGIPYIPFRLGPVDTAPGADTVAPKAPDTVSATALGLSSIKVSWSAVTLNEEPSLSPVNLAGYRVYRSPTSDTSLWVAVATLAAGDGDSFTDFGLSAETTYYYRVTAHDDSSLASFENQSYFSDSIASATTDSVYSGPIWYVNDTSTVSDSFTTAIGADTGDGSASAPFLRIDSALLKASAGETVQLDAGTYVPSDTITIDTSGLFFLGVDSALTVIDFNDSSATSMRAVYAQNVTGLTVRGLHVTNGRYGLLWQNVDQSTVQDVKTSYSSQIGFRLQSSSDTNTLSANSATKNAVSGFYLDASNGNVLSQNSSKNNSTYGMFLFSSSNNVLSGNEAANNDSYGIILSLSSGNTLSSNQSSNNLDIGLLLISSSNNNILSENTVSNNATHGVALATSSDSNTLISNIVSNNSGSGFVLDASSHNVLVQNTVDSNSAWGFQIAGASVSDTFRKNVFIGSPTFPDSAVFTDTSTAFDFTRNWWSTTDSVAIRAKIHGTGADSIVFVPYRLGTVDTALNADTIAPRAPDTVTATLVDDTTIQITWSATSINEEDGTAVGDLAGYRVWRDTSSANALNGVLTAVASVGPGTTFYVDSSLTPGQQYFYRVTALDNHTTENQSFFSDSIAFAVATDSTSPDFFTLLKPVEGTETNAATLTFEWSASSDSSDITYRIIVDTDMLGAFVHDTTVTDTNVTLTMPINDTYLWRVIAIDSFLNSTLVGDSSFIIDSSTPQPFTLISPANGTGTTALTLLFEWTASADTLSGLNHYQFQISQDSSFSTFEVDSAVGLDTSVLITLSQPDTYYWAVLALDQTGNIRISDTIFILAIDTPTDKPDSPTGVSASAGDQKVTLGWFIGSDTRAAGYHVYRGSDTSGPWTRVNAAIISLGTPVYNDTAVTNGTLYYYHVTAADSFGIESDPSRIVSATPFGETPAAPVGLSAAGSSGKIDLAWTANSEPDLGGYNLYRSTISGGPYALQLSVGLVTNVTDTDVNNDSTYYYVITAFDTETPSRESERLTEVSATPNEPDTQAPVITHTPVTSASASTAILIEAVVTDNVSVSNVTLYFQTTGGSAWDSISMSLSPPDSYLATIPDTIASLVGVDYRITARDASGNTRQSGSETNPHHINITSPDTAPPAIVHTPPTSVTTGSTVTISAFITDSSGISSSTLLYRVSGTTTFTSTSISLVSDSLYRGNIPPDSVTFAGIDYRIDATDLAGNASSDGIHSVPAAVGDSTAPTITHSAYTSATVGSDLTVTAEVIDNVALDTVTLFFAKIYNPWDSVIMVNVTGDDYSETIPAATITVADTIYRYYIEALDTAGNRTIEPDTSGWSFITTATDTTPPTISHTPVTNASPGVTITLTASVTDDSAGVAYVRLYWRKTGAALWRIDTMSFAGSNYSGSVPADSVTTVGIDYAIDAIDSAGNGPSWAGGRDTGDPFKINVTAGDVDPPVFTHTPVTEGVEGESIAISTTIADNSSVAFATLFYRHISDAAYMSTAMTGSGNIWSGTIPADSAIRDTVAYYMTAADPSGNSSTSGSETSPHLITIVQKDTIPPVLNHTVITKTFAHEDLPVSAEADDSQGIAAVTFHYRYKGGSSFTSLALAFDSGITYSRTLRNTLIFENLNIEYYIEALDISGNSSKIANETSPLTIHVQTVAEDLSKARTYPNPWTPSSGGPITIHELPPDPNMEITIFDRGGAFVMDMHVGREIQFSPNGNTAVWHGKTESGRSIAPGTYFAVVKSSRGTKVIRMTVIR